jgi:hypothetical protein
MMTLWKEMNWTQRRRYIGHRIWLRRQAIVYVALSLVVILSLYISTQRALERERAAQLTTCARVQFLRDQANGTNFLIYDTFKRVVIQQQNVIDSGQLRGKALQQAQESIKRAQDVVNTTLVTGPTDCKAATDHPDTYAAPAPEFIRDNSARVKIARQHAMDLVRKAKTHSPLYQGNKLPGNQGILGHGSG